MHSTKISGLAVDTEYTFHLVLRTSSGTRMSEKVTVRTHKMTDLSGITITTGILPASTKESLSSAVERIGAKIVDSVRIDTTHFVTTEGRGQAWEKAVETNIPVVRPEWVEACEKNGRILGVTKFYLDAMRPGPPSEESGTPPAVPAKSENNEESTANNTQASKKDDEESGDEDEKKAKEEGDDEEDDEEDEAAPEQKVRSPLPDEQKMRLEDKKEQKVALRPSTSSRKSEASKVSEEEEEEQTSEKPSPKPSPSPDGASFQEVEL